MWIPQVLFIAQSLFANVTKGEGKGEEGGGGGGNRGSSGGSGNSRGRSLKNCPRIEKDEGSLVGLHHSIICLHRPVGFARAPLRSFVYSLAHSLTIELVEKWIIRCFSFRLF